MKSKKIKVLTFFLIILITVVIGITYYICSEKRKENDENSQKISEQYKKETVINETKDQPQKNEKEDIEYTISVRDEIYATIKAVKNGKIISKEFEMTATIGDTSTWNIKNIGEVALVSESGGEYCEVHVYKLIEDEIKLLGSIDYGADTVRNASYTINNYSEDSIAINAEADGECITKKVEIHPVMNNLDITNLLGYGEVVLISEENANNYEIHAYRLSQDYVSGKHKEIKEVGTIRCNK